MVARTTLSPEGALAEQDDIVMYLDKNREIKWMNMAGLELSSNEVNRSAGISCIDYWKHDEKQCASCASILALETGEQHGTILEAKDNRKWQIRAIPIVEDGEMLGVIELMHLLDPNP